LIKQVTPVIQFKGPGFKGTGHSRTFPAYWDKHFWPGNSPDLNPIENLWSIMEGKVYCPPLATNKETLVKKIKDAWEYLKLRKHTILPNLLEGDRGWKSRCQKVIENQGGDSS
jgi:transposase